MLVMMLLCHAGDDATEATWPRCDVLLSQAGDGTTRRLDRGAM
jgi:hypothetical protein